MSKPIEIYSATWTFHIVKGKHKFPFKVQGVVTPRIPIFVLLSQRIYLERALGNNKKNKSNITFIKSLLKDKNTGYPVATITFDKFISNSFVDYNETIN